MRRSDKQVGMATLVVAALALLGIWLAGRHEHQSSDDSTDSITAYAKYSSRGRRASQSYAVPMRKAERFPFDPNTADSTQLLRLGLQPWQVRNIYKYRANGGIYRQKQDFARLYGLTVQQYRELEPYIQISSDYLPASTLFSKGGLSKHDTLHRDTLRYPVKIQEGEHIVLNHADTTQLRRVPGIGTYYAKQIMQLGQRLGGFVSVDQLDAIDGFPQSAKQYFVVQNPQTRRLNVNRLTLQQLRRHPYINYYQAKAIQDYRRLHGNLRSLDDLRLSRDFTDDDLRRLAPYVEF